MNEVEKKLIELIDIVRSANSSNLSSIEFYYEEINDEVIKPHLKIVFKN